MSAINNALSELASNHSHKPEQVVKAQVKPVKQLKVLPWVIGSFGLSLAVGGWALSSQSPELPQQPVSVIVAEPTIQIVSPTSKPSESSGVIYNPQSRTVNKPTKPAPVVNQYAILDTGSDDGSESEEESYRTHGMQVDGYNWADAVVA